jgi:[protein-PII] uridylyltransferase
VLVDNKASARHTVIEVNGRDRPGLLYQVTLALTKQQLIIHRAKISTYGERAVDVFYVQTALGGKVESEAKLKRIREKLLEALEQPSSKPASPAKAAKTPAKKAPAGKSRKSREQAGKAAAKAAGKAARAPAE